MAEWAELSEELARKALDVMHRAAHATLVDETMTPHELRIVIDTLTDTISGLVDRDVLDTIYSVRKELEL
jgi:hypothetical protein